MLEQSPLMKEADDGLIKKGWTSMQVRSTFYVHLSPSHLSPLTLSLCHGLPVSRLSGWYIYQQFHVHHRDAVHRPGHALRLPLHGVGEGGDTRVAEKRRTLWSFVYVKGKGGGGLSISFLVHMMPANITYTHIIPHLCLCLCVCVSVSLCVSVCVVGCHTGCFATENSPPKEHKGHLRWRHRSSAAR